MTPSGPCVPGWQLSMPCEALNGNAAAPDGASAVRVGMHTGPAVVAHGGREMSSATRRTSRPACRARRSRTPCVITAATQRLVAGLFVVEERGAQQLKGVRSRWSSIASCSRAACAVGSTCRRAGTRPSSAGRASWRARGSLGARGRGRGADGAGAGRGRHREIAPVLPAARADRVIAAHLARMPVQSLHRRHAVPAGDRAGRAGAGLPAGGHAGREAREARARAGARRLAGDTWRCSPNGWSCRAGYARSRSTPT